MPISDKFPWRKEGEYGVTRRASERGKRSEAAELFSAARALRSTALSAGSGQRGKSMRGLVFGSNNAFIAS